MRKLYKKIAIPLVFVLSILYLQLSTIPVSAIDQVAGKDGGIKNVILKGGKFEFGIEIGMQYSKRDNIWSRIDKVYVSPYILDKNYSITKVEQSAYFYGFGDDGTYIDDGLEENMEPVTITYPVSDEYYWHDTGLKMYAHYTASAGTRVKVYCQNDKTMETVVYEYDVPLFPVN